MKHILFTTLIFCFISCKSDKTEPTQISKRKIDPILVKLVSKYPNYTNNDLVLSNMNNEFLTLSDSLIVNNLVDDIPLKVFRISKNPHGPGAIVQLYSENSQEYNEPDIISNHFDYELVLFMPKDKAETLDQTLKYRVTAKKIKRLNHDELYAIVKQSYYSPDTKIEKDVVNEYKFQAGVFIGELDSISSNTLY